ncbi:hypothetical protein [Endozoicomonas sp. GU-1]|uniref:hypothetical protein n=1 Tax=Endozoicomonas sp. GU-1 TaxID=3009078 RepID=UPI0022B2F2C5|nr:hypothetical protein [Endozoicomonas sp. GU-1]WBA83819.1 hypothetical protein O2T12_12215 [Endozoicomonas sp. GU-1]
MVHTAGVEKADMVAREETEEKVGSHTIMSLLRLAPTQAGGLKHVSKPIINREDLKAPMVYRVKMDVTPLMDVAEMLAVFTSLRVPGGIPDLMTCRLLPPDCC